MTDSNTPRGFVLDVTLRVLLVLLVLGQVTYLAARYSLRQDFTADRLYSLSDSTRRVLAKLEDRLAIEAYFSTDEELPAVYRTMRLELRNFLDEYARMSGGKIVIQYFDPLSDSEIKKKAERLQVRPYPVNEQNDASLAFKEIWQGLRFTYRDEKQKVIPLMQFQGATAGYEAVITPIIKELTIREKPVIGLLAFATEAGGGGNPFQPQQRTQPKGFERLKEIAKGRYDLKDLDLNEGKLVPDEMKSVIVVRPKKLTDRQKFALDQFLMRGGKLIVFADTSEYECGQSRTFAGTPVPFDAPDAQLKFRDQLAHYGVRVEDKLIGEGAANAWDPFYVVGQTLYGQQAQQIRFPYWIRAVPLDWAEVADQLAREEVRIGNSNGTSMPELEAQYRRTFKPGVSSSETLFQAEKGGQMPAMYWACPVAPSDRLPEGVTAETLLRTSPLAFTKDPPADTDPIGANIQDGRERQRKLQNFDKDWNTALRLAPRRQYGLAVIAKGTFKSFFEGKPTPPRKPPEPKKPDAAKDPLKDPIQETPVNPDPTSQPSSEPAASQPAAGAESKPDVGPPVPPAEPESKPQDDKDKEPEPTYLGKPAMLLVIGDSDFIRDDLITGELMQMGGPVSRMGGNFFASLLDWLGEDQDLLALRNKQVNPRKISFGEPNPLSEENPEAHAQKIKAKSKVVRLVNVILPPAALLVVGVLLMVRRRTQKQTFLTEVKD